MEYTGFILKIAFNYKGNRNRLKRRINRVSPHWVLVFFSELSADHTALCTCTHTNTHTHRWTLMGPIHWRAKWTIHTLHHIGSLFLKPNTRLLSDQYVTWSMEWGHRVSPVQLSNVHSWTRCVFLEPLLLMALTSLFFLFPPTSTDQLVQFMIYLLVNKQNVLI